MKHLLTYLTLFSLMFVNPESGHAQLNDSLNIHQLFSGFLDSMLRVPADSKEAWDLTTFNSVDNKTLFSNIVIEQDRRIKDIEKRIDTILTKKNMSGHIRPRENPGPGPNRPGTIGNPEIFDTDLNIAELREDLFELNTAMDKISVIKQQFKNEINLLQDSVNIRLKKTYQNDHIAHLEIINSFIGKVSKLYGKYLNVLKENTRKTDDIIAKYDFGERVKYTPMELEILKTQSAQIGNLKFFFNIIKEFIMLGSTFYRKSISEK